MRNRSVWKKAGVLALGTALALNTGLMPLPAAHANYTTGFEHPGVGHDHGEAQWKENQIPGEGVDFSNVTVSRMMEEIEAFDFDKFAKDHADLPWIDSLLVNEGVIPDDINDEGSANTLFSRGSALYMKTQDNSKLGFVGTVHYADTLNQNSMFEITLSSGAVAENKTERKNYPSHQSQIYTSGELDVSQKKFITYGNTAVSLLELSNPTNQDIRVDLRVKSPFVKEPEGSELVGRRVAAPLMIGTAGMKVVEAMSYVDVRLSGTGMTPDGRELTRTITIPAGGSAEQQVVMGWLADEIPQSKAEYEQYKGFTDNGTAFAEQVRDYNEWWADNIPYIDIPDENVKKVLYYRWWCNRFNILDANIPGNDWQFPMNMEGVLGYNNGITVSVPWALQDLKWLRDPSYAYGTWLAQGEYSENKNYKNNPGRPNIWTWDMMQNSSQVGWEAYKIYGGGQEVLQKFADISANDVKGTLNHFKGTNPNLVYYNHGPITGNDGDTVSMHWNGGGNYARLDGSSTTYANAIATAEMYDKLGNTAAADQMRTIAGQIRQSILDEMWFDKPDFDNDGKADTNGAGSFLHKKVVNGADQYVPWRDNNMFVFNFGVVPVKGEAGYQDKYLTQLKDYGDPDYYPIFPFFTADQHSIMKRVEDYVNGKTDAYGTDQFAWCNFGNYINTIRASLRHYPVENIDPSVYKKLFDWGAWLHTVEPGNTDHLDSNEFFWLEDYFFGTNWSPENPPNPSGDMVRAWIHHDTLGMMNYTVMEDIAGLQPRTDDKIELWPINMAYDHFAVDNIRYHDANLSIVWQDPAKYGNQPHYAGIPAGYSLFINGERVMTTNEMSHVIFDPATGKAELPTGDVEGAVGSNANTQVLFEKGTPVALASADDTALNGNAKTVDLFNKAGVDIVHDGVNLAAEPGTTIESTHVAPGSDIRLLADGSTIASTDHKGNTALLGGSPNPSDTVTFTFDGVKRVDNVKVYFYNDRLENGYGTPQAFGVEYRAADGSWKPVTGQFRYPDYVASNYNNVEFEAVETEAIRLTVTHSSIFNTGIKEVQIYDNGLNVSPAGNQAPKVLVDGPVKVQQNETLKLVPHITDDGLPAGKLTYRWEKVSGEGEVETVADDQAVFQAVFKTLGDYVYKLTVSDGDKETTVLVPISVYVATAELTGLIQPFEAKADGRLIRNAEDFTAESWNRLQKAIADAKALLAKGSYTMQEINEATMSMRSAISGLRYLNAALLAAPSASYTSPWESVEAINDGYVPYTSGNINDKTQETQYGNWGGTGDRFWLEYTWKDKVELSGSSVYFFDDGGGVQVPGDYDYEYWDEAAGQYVPVTNLSGKPKEKDRFNNVTFDKISTTKLRLSMTKGSTSAFTGVKEWRVLTADPGGIGTNPDSHGPIVSVEPVKVSTTVGVIPALPAQVTVTYEDGTKGVADVVWNEIPLNEVSTAHSFTVLGQVAGTDLAASVLITVGYDKTKLKTAIDNAALVDETNYEGTPEQWAAFREALEHARSVYADAGTTEGDINDAYLQLQAAYAALTPVDARDASISGITVPGGSVDSLAGTITVPEQTTLEEFKQGLQLRQGVTADVYEADGVTPAVHLETGFKVISTAKDGETTRTYTIQLLVVTVPADTAALKQRLKEAQELELSVYTKATREALELAIQEAVNVLGKAGAAQSEVDAALAKLNETIDGLRKLPSVKFEQQTLTLTVGEQVKLQPVITPLDAAAGAKWSTSDQAVVTVDESGNVTGVAQGTAVIRITLAEEGASASIAVNVKAAVPSATPTPTSSPTPTPATTPTVNPSPTVPPTPASTPFVGNWNPFVPPSPSAKAAASASAAPAGTAAPGIVLKAEVNAAGESTIRLTDQNLTQAFQAGQGQAVFTVSPDPALKRLVVEIPAAALASVQNIGGLTLNSEMAGIQIDPKLLKLSGAANDNLQFIVSNADAETAVPQIAGGSAKRIELRLGGEALASSLTRQVKLSLPYAPASGEKPGNIVMLSLAAGSEGQVIAGSRYDAETRSVQFRALASAGLYVPVHRTADFSDIAQVAWAQDGIEALAVRGAVDGKEAGKFYPNDGVTRAEFLKIALNAFGLGSGQTGVETAGSAAAGPGSTGAATAAASSSTTFGATAAAATDTNVTDTTVTAAGASFSDVPADAWYADAVNTARKLGIVLGNPDGSFAPNARITRSEMTVMLHRLSQQLALPAAAAAEPVKPAAFRDAASIPAYAAEAIEAMRTAGVVGGLPNNTFNPSGTATRAEAAVMVYRLFERME